jgi:hypothetical protein
VCDAVYALLLQPGVRLAACTALEAVKPEVPQKIMCSHLSDIVWRLANNEHEESRVLCALVVNKFADVIGAETACALINLLYADPSLCVQRAVVQEMESVIALMTARNLPDKRADLICQFRCRAQAALWHMRQACATAIARVARALPPALRAELLVPIMVDLLEDEEKRVRHSADQLLGSFITALRAEELTKTPFLLERFAGIVRRTTGSCGGQAAPAVGQDLSSFVAASFTGVATAAGPALWPTLRGVLEVLANFESDSIMLKCSVLLPLAQSLADLARAVGPAAAARDLLRVFEKFMLHDNKDVRLGVVTCAAAFVGALPEAARVDCLALLQKVRTPSNRLCH